MSGKASGGKNGTWSAVATKGQAKSDVYCGVRGSPVMTLPLRSTKVSHYSTYNKIFI